MPKGVRINKAIHQPQGVEQATDLYIPAKEPKAAKVPKEPKAPKTKFTFFDPDSLLPREGDLCDTCPEVLKKGNYEIMLCSNGKLFGCCRQCKPRHIKLEEIYS